MIHIDAQSGEGLQQQVYRSVRRAVLDGILESGTRLPSSRALAGDLRVSRTTTLLAYEQLLAEGYLQTRRGSGTFVAAPLPDDLPLHASPRRVARAEPPQLSRRGAALAGIPGPARRIGGPPRAFRLGVPSLDRFPLLLWSQLVRRRMRSTTAGQLDYADAAGCLELRKAIADHVQAARGTICAADQVVVVAGAQRALQMIAALLLDPGDRVWLEDPGYPGARSALTQAGARIVPAHVDGQGLDVAAATRRAPDARLAYVTPSNQFPLGVTMSLPRRLALLEWARRTGAWIVEDDYDSEYRYSGRPVPALQGLDGAGSVLFAGSFSKVLFPSLRLGYLVLPPDLVDRAAPPPRSPAATRRSSSSGCSSTSSRRATSAATCGGCARSMPSGWGRCSTPPPPSCAPVRCGCGRFRRGYTPSQTWTASMTSGCARKRAAAASKWRRCAPTTWTVPRRAVFCSGSRPPRRQPCAEVSNNWPRRSTPHVARIAHDATADRLRVRRRKARVLVVDLAMRPAESLSSWETHL